MRAGVTLHLLISDRRDPITGVPAVYFVQPTEENVRYIIKDLSDGLYDKVYLNFAAPLPRPLLEMLAAGALESDRVATISKVFDQHLSFTALEADLFSLALPNFYTTYNSRSATEAAIESAMNAVSGALFSVCVSLGQVPIIRCPPGGPAEMVARKLEATLRDHVSGRSSLFTGGAASATFQRPVLVLLDRNVDMAVMLAHTSTYRALLDDTLGIRLNRVTVSVEKSGERTRKTYDLDRDSDGFWAHYAGHPFPEAVAANGQELQEVVAREKEIRSKTGGAAAGAGGDVSSGTDDLASTVDQLQPLMKRKALLEMHTNILRAVMDEVAERHIPTFFEAEQAVLQGRGDTAEVVEKLRGENGSVFDKLRLALVHYLACDPSQASSVLDELTTALSSPSGGEDAAGGAASAPSDAARKAVAALRYAKSVRMVSTMMAPLSRPAPAAPEAGWLAGLRQVGAGATDLLAKATAAAKTLLPSSSKLPVTRIVDAICENKPHDVADSCVTIDPKLARGGAPAPSSYGAAGGGFRTAIVFVVGGGNYTEYQNLQDYAAKQTPRRTIIYGSTSICRPEEFAEELATLGTDLA